MVRLTLAPEVVDALWAAAEVMSEGDVRPRLGGPERADGDPPARDHAYFGSTMITVPIGELARALGVERIEEPELRLVVELLDGSTLVRARIARIARREAKSRVPGRPLGRALTETRMRLVSGRLEIDVDIEAPIEPDAASRSRRA